MSYPITTIFQICQYFLIAGHICHILQLSLFFQKNGLEMYVFACNLAKYLYYRGHPHDCIRKWS